MHFLILLGIFAVIYFGICLPLFQLISQRKRGRKFIIRLGGSGWNFRDAEHRWDVLMSFLSFMIALAVSMIILDQLFPFDK